MSRALRQTVKDNVHKCRAATIAAVDSYNRSGSHFRTAQYLVMITIAWTALFHAAFYHRGKRPWYRSRTGGTGTGVRYQKIDGEPKHWDLSECLKQFYGGDHPPERRNLEFLIGLRNKIEHRHLPELDGSLFGECQSALLNFETFLVNEFGQQYALTEQLAVSLQMSRVTPPEKKKAAQVLASTSAKTVADYIERFRGSLPTTVLNSMKYSYNVFLVPKVVNRRNAADAAVEFVPIDEASDEELKRLERLNVLIREKHIPITNLGLYRPGQVVEELIERVPLQVTMHTHTMAWKHYGVRPAGDDPHPERTRQEYCIYDDVHEDYVYTKAWIEKLVQDLSDPETYNTIVGWRMYRV